MGRYVDGEWVEDGTDDGWIDGGSGGGGGGSDLPLSDPTDLFGADNTQGTGGGTTSGGVDGNGNSWNGPSTYWGADGVVHNDPATTPDGPSQPGDEEKKDDSEKQKLENFNKNKASLLDGMNQGIPDNKNKSTNLALQLVNKALGLGTKYGLESMANSQAKDMANQQAGAANDYANRMRQQGDSAASQSRESQRAANDGITGGGSLDSNADNASSPYDNAADQAQKNAQDGVDSADNQQKKWEKNLGKEIIKDTQPGLGLHISDGPEGAKVEPELKIFGLNIPLPDLGAMFRSIFDLPDSPPPKNPSGNTPSGDSSSQPTNAGSDKTNTLIQPTGNGISFRDLFGPNVSNQPPANPPTLEPPKKLFDTMFGKALLDQEDRKRKRGIA